MFSLGYPFLQGNWDLNKLDKKWIELHCKGD